MTMHFQQVEGSQGRRRRSSQHRQSSVNELKGERLKTGQAI